LIDGKSNVVVSEMSGRPEGSSSWLRCVVSLALKC